MKRDFTRGPSSHAEGCCAGCESFLGRTHSIELAFVNVNSVFAARYSVRKENCSKVAGEVYVSDKSKESTC